MKRKGILIVDNNGYEREFRAPLAIEKQSMLAYDCFKAANPNDAILQLQMKDGIAGVISALNFPDSREEEIIWLGMECRLSDIPLLFCISREQDAPSEEQMAVLAENGIEYIVIYQGCKDWECAVGKIMREIQV